MMESILKVRRKSEILVKAEPPEEVDEPNFASSIISGLLTRSIISPKIRKEALTTNKKSKSALTSTTKLIQLGQTFNSFADVLLAVRMYECKNKVNLTQKYFRRIAANPKPSNKEDYSLSVEERKRFVYRWVDFCCTYFDSLLARTDISEEGTAPAIGFTIKECPMRIRFQMRFQEKDLIVSIFREAHDHTHPDSDDPLQTSKPSKDPASGTAFDPSNHVPKQNLRPPPSLAPLPNRQASSSTSLSSPLQNKKGCPSTQQAALVKLPRPPPLKGPGTATMTSSAAAAKVTTTTVTTVTNVSEEGSSKIIVRNIYNFLLRTKMHRVNGEGSKHDIIITSPNPDLIKLTSEMTGVDQNVVREAALGRSIQTKPIPQRLSFNATAAKTVLSPTRSDVDISNRRITKRSYSQNCHQFQQQKKRNCSDLNDSDSADGWTPYFGGNSESCDAYKKLANLPLDITIKPQVGSCDSEEDDNYAMTYNDEDEQDQDNYNYFSIRNDFNGR